MYDIIVVGAGFAGATFAQKAASAGKKVLIIDKRDHLGGNAYDYEEEGILIHKYGPHIFHTSSQDVFEYLSQFCEWYEYHHKVIGHIQGKVAPIPFNYESIDICFTKDKADRLKRKLKEVYGDAKRVPIMELLKERDDDLKDLADFVFENVFKYYTMKQWGLSAEEIDPGVTARVPVRLSYKDGYFDDTYQYMPKEGYTKIFERMLDHENIEVRLNTKASDILTFKGGEIFFEGKWFNKPVIYTGALDELFDYELGSLPYRSLYLDLQRKEGTFQDYATENYPGPANIYPYTRISEYKLFMENPVEDHTFIHTEYPLAYDKDAEKGNIPYYPIFTEDNQKLYEKYLALANQYSDLVLLGRLAEYKYYNMDAIILRALQLAQEMDY